MSFSAILFDRDGTLIADKHYLSDPAGVELFPGVGEALSFLREKGVKSFVVSNQSGIGRGYFPEEGWHACERRLAELLDFFGAGLDGERFCPHAPEENCLCRKPGTQMWESLCREHGLAPEDCAMVGDKAEDLRFGVNAHLAAAVLVMTGKGKGSAEKLGISAELAESNGFCAIDIPGWDTGATRLFVAADAPAAVRGLLALGEESVQK